MNQPTRSTLLLALCCAIGIQHAAAQRSDFTILLTNDDGYDAPGLRALIEELSQIAIIVVASPRDQQSGASHGITYREPLMVQTIEESDTLTWYTVTARPVTTVRLALVELMDRTPDLVVSGINADLNLGTSTWVGGTVGAAREAALYGIPAIAVSLEGRAREVPGDYDAAADYIRSLIEDLRRRGMLEGGLLLNVNVPQGAANGVAGVQLASASTRAGVQGYERRHRPRGGTYFWDTWREKEDDAEGTDIHGIAQGYITITPLMIDQTDYARIEAFEFLTQP